MMKYNFKKILAGVMAVLSVTAFIPATVYSPLCNNSSITASAAEIDHGECGDSLSWSLDEQGTLKITGSGNAMSDYASDHSAPWYEYRNEITNLNFNSAINLNYIGSYAFYDCTNISEIGLHNELNIIGKNAFQGCIGLTSISIPQKAVVEDSAFMDCTNLTNIFINGSKVKTFGENVFSGCNIAKYYVPASILSDYQNSPDWSDVKDKIESCPSVTYNGSNIIEDSTILFNSSNQIKPYMPKGPKGALFLGWYTDKDFEEIFDSPFTVSSDITVYAKWYFGGKCGDDLNWSIDDDGILTISGSGTKMTDFTDAGNAPWSELKKLIRSVEITAPNLKNISQMAFYQAQNLESVTIENIESIGENAFSGCSSLKTVIFNCQINALTNAFANCSAIENIIVPAKSLEYYQYALQDYEIKITAIPAELVGHHLSVNGDITINFYADIPDIKRLENGEMRFTVGGIAAPAVSVNKAVKSADDKYYIFPVSIPAKNMYDKINAQFYVNGKAVSQVYHFNISDYADTLKSDFEGYTDFVDALLEYGCQAAAYFNIKSAPTPKNSPYAYDDILTALNEYSESTNKKPSYVGTSLLLKSTLYLRNYYNTQVSDSVQSQSNKGLYYIETEFSPAQFGEKLDNCCVYNYIYRVLKSENADIKLKNVCSSLYNLSLAFIKMKK